MNNITFVNKAKLKTIKLASLDPEKSRNMEYASVAKPYNKHYEEENVTPNIPLKTIYQVIKDNNRDNLDGIALIYEDNEITFDEFFKEVDKAAKGLQALGIKKGDTIAAALTSTPEAVYLLYATSKIGVTFASIDPRDSVKELKSKLLDAKPKCFFITDGFNKESELRSEIDFGKTINVSTLRSLHPSVKAHLAMENPEMFQILEDSNHITYDKFIDNGKDEILSEEVDFDYNNVAVMVYTGASTGNGKGVKLNDYSFNALGICQKNSDFPWERGKRFLNVLPQFIAYGICNSLHVPLMYGQTNILANPLRIDKFDEYLLKYKPDHTFGSPIHIRFLKNSKLINEDTDLSFLEMFACGGAGMPLDEDIENRKFFEAHGAKDVYGQGWGLTEANAAVSYGRGSKNKEGYVGIPFAGNDVVIVDAETLEEIPYGKGLLGVVMVKTPTMMMGYFGEHALKNEKIFVKDQDDNLWLSVEDVTVMDEEGRIKIVDRQSRGFNCMGMNIYPSTVESVLSHHKAIYETTVVGMPHEVLDMAPIANVVLYPEYRGKEETIADELDEIIAEEFPDYTKIYAYNFRENLPYTTRGKPDYQQMQAEGIDDLGNNKVLVRTFKTPKEILGLKGN